MLKRWKQLQQLRQQQLLQQLRIVFTVTVILMLLIKSPWFLINTIYAFTTTTISSSISDNILLPAIQRRSSRSTITRGTAPTHPHSRRRTKHYQTTTSSTQLHSKYLSRLVTGATVDERFDTMIFPGPIRGIGVVVPTNRNPQYVLSTIRSNTKIATIPAQNVLIVSNYRRDKIDYLQLSQQQQQQQQQQQRNPQMSYKDFSMWDRDLALLLWKEYLQVVEEKKSRGPYQQQGSPLTGYIEYLCQQDEFSILQNNPYYSMYDSEFDVVPLEMIDVDTYVPPSTAPHTIRQWTNQQKSSLLSQYTRGQQLLQIAEQQERIWAMKYDSIRIDPKCSSYTNLRMSYEQFAWAMEVVHSRAFCGLPIIVGDNNVIGSVDSTSTSTTASKSNLIKLVKSVVPSILAPIVAAALGYIYLLSTVFPNAFVLTILALLGSIPLLIQFYQSFASTFSETITLPSWLPFSSSDQQPQPQQQSRYRNVDQSAVLLPIVDSANHHIDTMKDTNIVYNPLRHTFEWMIGPQSFIEQTNVERPPLRRRQQSQKEAFSNAVPTVTITSKDLVSSPSLLQLCISYGKQPKSDNEWMINYGFLPGVSIDADIDNFDQYRYFLSQQFLERNP